MAAALPATAPSPRATAAHWPRSPPGAHPASEPSAWPSWEADADYQSTFDDEVEVSDPLESGVCNARTWPITGRSFCGSCGSTGFLRCSSQRQLTQEFHELLLKQLHVVKLALPYHQDAPARPLQFVLRSTVSSLSAGKLWTPVVRI